jgi:hypothetical protein
VSAIIDSRCEAEHFQGAGPEASPEVTRRRPKFTGSLLKKIDPDEAPTLGLRAAFALPPSEEDIAAHIQSEERARWNALDKHFGLDSTATNITERRAKLLIALDTGTDVADPQWWERVAIALARRYVLGFSIRDPLKKKKHGAPREWTDERRAQLIADIEYLRKTSGKSTREICKILPRLRGYSARWGRETGEALRVEYGQARKRNDVLFDLIFCGPEAAIPANGIDRIEAAIQRHALQIKLRL